MSTPNEHDEDMSSLFDIDGDSLPTLDLTKELEGLGAAPDQQPNMPLTSERARYRIKCVLGHGSAGTVYLGEVIEQKPSSEPIPDMVALKVMDYKGDEPSESHRSEISLMKGVKHPNVVQLYDWGIDGKALFSVLHYCEQGSLLRRVLREGPLSAETAKRLLREMLEALVVTHRLGILHLDIKPGNVLIAEDGRFLLTDFGISRSLFQKDSHRITGTPAFMPPEQARGENIKLDARSDLFALGAMLWYCITGDFSHKELSQREAIRLRERTTLPKLEDRVSDDYKDLAGLVDTLLAFDQRRRPGSAAEVLLALDKIDPHTKDRAEEWEHISKRGTRLDREWRVKLRGQIADPVLRELLKRWGKFYRLRLYNNGELICDEEEHSYEVYILLHGQVEVHRHGKLLAVESREGEILGEVAALTGTQRTARLQARGEVVLASLNGAELEQASRIMPALAVRLMKGLATRFAERDMIGPV
ncbi:MAG: serine/threonine-protein kinase [Acidobacteriota bacterium]|nr:serine/threonine-protein kinase [Acidobacteriota bacterium]